jgi:hypothetical protein
VCLYQRRHHREDLKDTKAAAKLAAKEKKGKEKATLLDRGMKIFGELVEAHEDLW